MNDAYLIVGSNIQPETNTHRALRLLCSCCHVLEVSTTWETKAVGSTGPDFLDTALHIKTDFSQENLKYQVLRKIEHELGRKRSEDKNAPRTIDLDIVVFNDLVVDENLWTHAYLAIPVSELLPDLIDPHSGVSLKQIAAMISFNTVAIPRFRFEL